MSKLNLNLIYCSLAIIAGLGLGCSAPGIGVSIAAWFCLTPLLFIVNLEESWAKTWLYGFLFGFAYNCIYWQWLLNLAPLDWLGFNNWQGVLMSWAALFIVAGHQAILIAFFALAYRLIFNSRLLIVSDHYSWLGNWLHIMLVPVLWILIVNKIGNAHCLMGVPFSMLEYSQYKNIYLLQAADTIGGIGISFLLVMVNTLLERMYMRFLVEDWKKATAGNERVQTKRTNKSGSFVGISSSQAINLRRKYFSIVKPVIPSVIFVVGVLISVFSYGYSTLSTPEPPPNQPATVVQPNINIEMYKTEKKYSIDELLALEIALSGKCPPGLCIWTEGALPTRLANNTDMLKQLQNLCASKKLSLIAGTIDQDDKGNAYNTAAAVSNDGKVSKNFYHKRYLVPFGEYSPAFVDWLPCSQMIRTLTNTPAGTGYACGNQASILRLNDAVVAPLICFEIIAPELAAASVGAGGELLVNINDLSWFHKSIIGEQMIACAVMRAVENRRYCIFASNTGPSAIISPTGEIETRLKQNICGLLPGKVAYIRELSVYTRWLGI